MSDIIDLVTDHSSTPQMLAALLATPGGIDVNWTDARGRTALSWACELGKESLVKMLLEQPNINPKHHPQTCATPQKKN